MTRTDQASRVVNAEPEHVFAALLDPDALLEWLPPSGMTGRFDSFDPREGGGYKLVLTYAEAPADRAKTTTDSDVVDARFVEIVPGVRVVQEVDFVSDNADFEGTMTMTWELSRTDSGTHVAIRAADVPPGISAEDHAVGLASSLDNLSAYLERH